MRVGFRTCSTKTAAIFLRRIVPEITKKRSIGERYKTGHIVIEQEEVWAGTESMGCMICDRCHRVLVAEEREKSN